MGACMCDASVRRRASYVSALSRSGSCRFHGTVVYSVRLHSAPGGCAARRRAVGSSGESPSRVHMLPRGYASSVEALGTHYVEKNRSLLVFPIPQVSGAGTRLCSVAPAVRGATCLEHPFVDQAPPAVRCSSNQRLCPTCILTVLVTSSVGAVSSCLHRSHYVLAL